MTHRLRFADIGPRRKPHGVADLGIPATETDREITGPLYQIGPAAEPLF